MKEKLQQLKARLERAQRVVVMTGAGASAESGIPTFRDALSGLWSRYRAEDLATPEAFQRDPELVSRWYESRRQAVLNCEPNGGHRALAQMQAWLMGRGRSFQLITQNVDGLHQRAGSEAVLELHGSILRWRTVEHGDCYDLPPQEQQDFPARTAAGDLLRPDVVWFGEALSPSVLQGALQAAAEAELFMAVGTSAVVYPAAGLIDVAGQAGAYTVEINPSTTPASQRVDVHLAGRSAELLPQVMALLGD